MTRNMQPPEPMLCPKCGDDIDMEGKCDDEECGYVICCYEEGICYCEHPDV